MVYPRVCPSCGRDEPSPEQLYSTRAAVDGGTPSPWRPEQPGRILDLRCGALGAGFRWDYWLRAVEMTREGDPEGLPKGSGGTTSGPSAHGLAAHFNTSRR
jgi:hypothetical protein